ncbi:acyl-CoA carboxylase subunit beta [Salsipaludibacter albus]|uniref:acyl-CoA carboxylase subunit beta n=1 Tax=Salsipaludibacter albus TaxID=2849650 RepID=UPI001EE49A13|nr:acyl-CoA carboxylase subunit beta [Salsipaludibacter albus]
MSDVPAAEAPAVDPAALKAGDNARARLERLLDQGSFLELGSRRRHRASAFGLDTRRPDSDGVVAGTGRIGSRPVNVYAQDRRVLGGSLGEAHADKIARTIHKAVKGGVPVVGVNDSGGARIQEGVAALDGYGQVFSANVAASGRVPQIALILGPCAGGAVYSPALMDFVVMSDEAYMFLTGPRVVKAVTGEEVDARGLGGPEVHAGRSGVCHFVVQDDEEAFALTRRLLDFLPRSAAAPTPSVPAQPPADVDLDEVVPTEGRVPYDVRDVIAGLVDAGDFLEVQPKWAPNLVIGFARIDGETVGIVANQAKWLAGVLDLTASEKGARFVRFCDAFGIPLVVLVDVPGFLPGTAQEYNGVIRKGAKLLHAFTSATVPRVTVVMRKAFGGSYIVMNSRSLGADAVLAWPHAELAVMGAEGAADVIFRRQIEEDPSRRDDLIDAYRSEAMQVDLAARRGSVDEIIEPNETRRALVTLLGSLRGGREPGYVHDNLPQ